MRTKKNRVTSPIFRDVARFCRWERLDSFFLMLGVKVSLDFHKGFE